MKEKEIRNIVFYEFESETGKRIQTCVFYKDGTVLNTDKETGVEEAKKLKQQKRLNEKNLDEYMNKKYIYAVSGLGLETHFKNFQNSDTPLDEIKKKKKPERVKKRFFRRKRKEKKPSKIKDSLGKFLTIVGLTKLAKYFENSKIGKAITKHKASKKTNPTEKRKLRRRRRLNRRNKEKRSFKNTGLYKFFHDHVILRVGAIILTLGLGMTAGGCVAKKHTPDANNQTTTSQTIDKNSNAAIPLNLGQENFLNYTFTELLEATSEKHQANTMSKIGETLDNFNDNFASKYLEQGKDIRAALSWDEASAMKLVYNNYSKEDIQKIYNGAELDKTALSNAYKTGSLQLMGAYVIETRENPVQMESLIDSEEGKVFYAKYHEMFLKASESTGQEQINKVNQFYQELYKDFPIDDQTREEGIAHADGRASVESYKFSIIPMVSAAEMMFQNLAIDYTLSDKAIEYLDDIGACNLADEIIGKASQVSLVTSENKKNPSYEEYKEAKIKEQQSKNIYVIDDEHRDLSQLDAFKNKVTIKFKINNGVFSGEVYYTVDTTSTKTDSQTTYATTTTEEKTDNRNRAVELAGEGNVAGAENVVDQEIEKENQAAKDVGENQADQNASNMQQEADADTAENNKEVADSEKDLQDQLGNANDKIDNKQPVKEEDLGDHNVDFDQDHSNDEGQLDDSIKDLTTDGTGSNNTLPDPNVTGGTFEGQEQTPEQPTSNPTGNESGQNIYEYEEEVPGLSNEEKANNIVENLANAPTDDGKAPVYTK